MYGPFFGEFMGTLVLILLGDGAVANVLLKKSKGENSGWIVITTGWGMAVVAGIFTAIALGSPGAHNKDSGFPVFPCGEDSDLFIHKRICQTRTP